MGERNMSDSNNKRGGLISNAFGVAKKLGSTGFSMLNHVAPGSVSKMTQKPNQDQIIQGQAKEQLSNKQKYDNPQAMMRDHIPLVSRQLLGKHYGKINNVASFISPELNDKLSDYFFEKLNDFVSNLSSVEAILKEVGAKDLNELANNPERSARISQAFENQNKRYAVVQGALTGVSGVIGAAIDVPTSIALALHSIYQTGRAYGFELKTFEEQEVVEFVFKQIDIGTVAEKQTLLVAVRAVAGLLETHDVNQLQKLLGSDNDTELLKKWIGNDDGTFKWSWLNSLPQLSIVSKLIPLAGAGIGAYFSLKLLNDATFKAQKVFSNAREYLNNHPDEKLDIVDAYEHFQKQGSAALLLATDAEPLETKVETAAQTTATENLPSAQKVQDVAPTPINTAPAEAIAVAEPTAKPVADSAKVAATNTEKATKPAQTTKKATPRRTKSTSTTPSSAKTTANKAQTSTQTANTAKSPSVNETQLAPPKLATKKTAVKKLEANKDEEKPTPNADQ